MNTTFRIAATGNHFRWDVATDFRAMRAFLMLGTMDRAFLHRLVDKLDDIREMPEGQTMFIVCSDWDLSTGKTIEALNHNIALRCGCVKDGTLNEHYAPHCAGFGIKRTKKCYVYIPLESVPQYED